MIELVCPIMIGDFDPFSNSYSNYFKSGSHPALGSMKEVVVNSIETKVMEVLDSQSLGMPLIDKSSVKDIIDNITKNQGCFLEGDMGKTITEAMDKIYIGFRGLVTSSTDEEEDITGASGKKKVMMEEVVKVMKVCEIEDIEAILSIMKVNTC